MRPWEAAGGALVLLALALAPPGLASHPCSSPSEAVEALRGELQNDAKAGRDAGDCPAGALDMAGHGYTWGYLDALEAAELDAHDWFSSDLAGEFGLGQDLAIIATGNVLSYMVPNVAVVHVPIYVDLLPPNLDVVTTIHSCMGGTVLVDPAPGAWLFHAYRLPLTEAPPCSYDGTYPVVFGTPAEEESVGADYGIYRGCHPVCVR